MRRKGREAPPTATARALRAVRAEAGIACEPAMHGGRRFGGRPARLEGGGPAASPLRRRRLARWTARAAVRRKGRFPGGACAPVWQMTCQVMVWNGSRTRNAGITIQYSTNEHSKATTCRNRTGNLRLAPPRSRCAMSSCRSTAFRLRHTPRQRRAHRTGSEPVPLETVRSMLRIAGRRRSAIRVPMRSPPPPASSIAMQRLRASWRSSAQRRPARGPRCPGVRAGCCGMSVKNA